MQAFSFGKKYFDDFNNKKTLEENLKEGRNPREIAVLLGISHQTVRDELFKGIEDETDFLKRRYSMYSAKYSRQQDITKVMAIKVMAIVEQFKQEMSE